MLQWGSSVWFGYNDMNKLFEGKKCDAVSHVSVYSNFFLLIQETVLVFNNSSIIQIAS